MRKNLIKLYLELDQALIISLMNVKIMLMKLWMSSKKNSKKINKTLINRLMKKFSHVKITSS